MSAKPTVDLDLREQQVQDLSNRDAVAGFFAALGYDTAARTRQTAANLGITAEGLANQIRHAELLADQEGLLQVYLFELNSVTVAATQGLARVFRNRAGNFLLVLTTRDYDHLDFVLLERYVPEGVSPTAMTGRREGAVRPRVLSVERLKPSRVEMRVLRRFTYTEGDPLSQYEKLLSAYTVADWSEENFNNRALFADYYLMERLPLEPEWQEKSRDPYLAVRDLFRDGRTRWAGKSEAELRKGLLEPALRSLGFGLESVKAAGSDAPRPDYLLKSPEGGDLGVCLAYPWGRFLDGKDYQRDGESPDENPGALVLSLLQNDGAKWAIVTNGKHWRLYSARTHSRATNYYEIDLEETLAAQDPAELFRYFWVLFRAKAFEPRTVVKEGREEASTFLDQLLDGSEAYAKRLGDRLKGRVFDDIFPHLAQGFVAYRKAREGTEADLSQEALDEVFQGTLTLLYRLLFLLYAEARDLLPVRETRAYNQVSLTRLKREVAQAAGDDPGGLADRLKKVYGSDSTDLYDRLLTLFRAVDKGDAALNMPVYNGGLFISEPDPKDDSPETRNARFLLANKVPDRYLATALDLLARDEDEKTFKRAFIDYKSLGVRQLGSIYEGLLEFHLRLASEKMAVCKGKKTEEVVSYRQAVKEKRTILKHGRGKEAPERTLPKGTVYLENTRHERKATGSYYTPDYIVKYIVQHTVGPVLEEKFRAMEPKLREAQQAYRQAVKRQQGFQKQGLEGDNPEKVARDYRDLVDELFDVKVLDPAMGSGHFLVETVDFVADRMIVFLNGFRWNPITAPLGKLGETRRTVLREMEEQGITIDPQSRTLMDNSLLKRHILKRCIYGVDLNQMAVELAKVSLWLDCFTLGAPLSFLDHHLKCGNSLIGAQDVDDAIVGARRRAELLRAITNYLQIGTLADATSAQVGESKRLWMDAEAALAATKRRLNVDIAKHFVALGSEVAAARAAQCAYTLEASTAEDRKRFELAQQEAGQRRFFHWQLEFPEIWFGVRPDTERVVTRKKDGGFDAVVGNPPYRQASAVLDDQESESLMSDRRGMERMGFTTLIGRWDLYVPFVELATSLARPGGYCAQIISDAVDVSPYAEPLRELLCRSMALRRLDLMPDVQVFDEVGVKNTIYCAQKEQPQGALMRRLHVGGVFGQETVVSELPSNSVSTKVFDPLYEPGLEVMQRFAVPLGIICFVSAGAQLQSDEQEHRGEFTKEDMVAERPQVEIDQLYVGGADVARYGITRLRYVAYDRYKAIIKRPRFRELFTSPKVMVGYTSGGLYDDGQSYKQSPGRTWLFCNHNVLLCVPWSCLAGLSNPSIQRGLWQLNDLLQSTHARDSLEAASQPYSVAALAAVCLSTPVTVYTTRNLRRSVMSFTEDQVKQVPIRRIHFTTPVEERATLAEELKGMYHACLCDRRQEWVGGEGGA